VVQSGCTTHPGYRGNGRLGWKNPGFVQTDRDPVVCLSWHDTGAFIAWLNEKSRSAAHINGGGTYRLPTEAEWEYGARAGQQATRWWGEAIGRGLANCRGCGSIWDGERTAPTDAFMPNAFGLVGMLGNARQWTQDCWNPNYEGSPSDARAWTMGNCVNRVLRGGDWGSSPWVVRAALRTRADTNRRANTIGFRVAKTLP
jgi:formylglycine-generating enzyme required for sulfatase activity